MKFGELNFANNFFEENTITILINNLPWLWICKKAKNTFFEHFLRKFLWTLRQKRNDCFCSKISPLVFHSTWCVLFWRFQSILVLIKFIECINYVEAMFEILIQLSPVLSSKCLQAALNQAWVVETNNLD